MNLALLEPSIDAGTAVLNEMHFDAWVTPAEAADQGCQHGLDMLRAAADSQRARNSALQCFGPVGPAATDVRERTTSSPTHGRQFIEDICEVVRRAVSDPPRLLKAPGEPKQAGIGELYRSDELSILNVARSPHMMIMPHNHRMWTVIGVYGGRKDNIFWRRIASADGAQIEASGARSLCAKEAQPLGRDIIPAAVHIYGGDFFAVYRSEWDPETLREQPSDGERAPDIRGSQPTLCRRLKLRREPA